MKLKFNDSVIDFEQVSEEQYEVLAVRGILIKTYPFCAGYGYDADREEYHRILEEIEEDAKK